MSVELCVVDVKVSAGSDGSLVGVRGWTARYLSGL